MTTPISEAKGVPPSEYAQLAERVLARHERALRERRRDLWLRRAAFVSIAILAAVTVWCIIRKP